MIRVNFFILVRDPSLFKRNPTSLNERAELDSRCFRVIILTFDTSLTHPATVEYEILWFLVPCHNELSGISSMGKDLCVRDAHVVNKISSSWELIDCSM